MKQHESNLWVTTFRDATKYMRERMSAKVDSKKEGNEIHITVTHTLDPSLYALPITLKTYVDANDKNISVKQGNENISFVSDKDDKGSFILYQAKPNNDVIVISKN